MTNAQKATYLREYRTMEREAARTKTEWLFWRRRAREAPTETDARRAGERERYYSRMLLERYRRCLGTRLLVEQAVLQIPAPRDRLLLRLHYVDGRTLEDAAEEIGVSPRHVMRLHKQLLEKITLPEPFPSHDEAAFTQAMARLAGILCGTFSRAA